MYRTLRSLRIGNAHGYLVRRDIKDARNLMSKAPQPIGGTGKTLDASASIQQFDDDWVNLYPKMSPFTLTERGKDFRYTP
jgi:hypothetical protein